MPMRGPRVTLEQWRTLQTVVDSGGYAQAAEALHKSQSSVSYTVSKLQDQLGMELLHIEGRRAVLTPAGETLLQRSRHLIEQAMQLEQVALGLEQGWEAEVRLAVDGAFPKSALVKALQAFQPQSQGTRLLLREEILSGASEALLERKADLAITPWVPPGFMGEKLLEIHFIAVAHPDHPLHHLGRKVTAHDMSQEMQLVIKDSGVKQNRDSGWLGSDQRWTVTSMDSAIQLLANKLGFAWITTFDAVDPIEKGVLKPLDLDVEYAKHGTLYLVYAQKDVSGPATQMLADSLKESSDRFTQKLPSCEQLRGQNCDNQGCDNQ